MLLTSLPPFPSFLAQTMYPLPPAMEVEVEALDVNDDEARALLLSIDPLAELAQAQEQLRDRLREVAPPVPPELAAAWQAAAAAILADKPERPGWQGSALAEQFYALITCRDEPHQVELLGRFLGKGLACKAVLG